LRAAEPRKPKGAFTLNKRFESLVQQSRAIEASCQFDRLGEQGILKRNGRAHRSPPNPNICSIPISAGILAPIDA
jgi:hypothetical protein